MCIRYKTDRTETDSTVSAATRHPTVARSGNSMHDATNRDVAKEN